jgi:hypothetical protein
MYKLGKKPYVPSDKDFKLSTVQVSLPPVPKQPFGYGRTYADWGMLGNDDYGDCVWAGADHETMLWTHLAGGHTDFVPANALSDYSTCTGFNINDPNTDQGTDVRTAMGYRRNTGIVDSNGVRHKIDAYVSIDPKNWDLLLTCVWTFGVVGMGFEFPDSAMQQFDNGEIWDVVPGTPDPNEGHYVPVVGSPDTANECTCITWGKRQVLTKAFYEQYNDESWVPLTKESLLPASNVRHIDWSHLSSMLASL